MCIDVLQLAARGARGVVETASLGGAGARRAARGGDVSATCRRRVGAVNNVGAPH